MLSYLNYISKKFLWSFHGWVLLHRSNVDSMESLAFGKVIKQNHVPLIF